MPAYFVYVCQKVFDRVELEAYWAKIGATLEGYGAKSIAAYTHFEQLEGDEVDGAAVIEFSVIRESEGVVRESSLPGDSSPSNEWS